MKRCGQFLLTFLFLLLIWQGIVFYFQLPDYILPSPVQVFFKLYIQRNILAAHASYTFLETSLGFLCGILSGCLAGFLLTIFPLCKKWFLPLLIISQAIPTFAIAPLFVIWLGYGLSSKMMITTLMIFFPIMSAFYDGLNETPAEWLDLAKTMNASPLNTFCLIKLPAALPKLASGIRIAAVAAPIGAIVGEWVGSSRGLGYLMLNANARLQIDDMFAALIIILIMTLSLYFMIDKLLHKLVWWQP